MRSLLSYLIFGLALYHVSGMIFLLRAYWIERAVPRDLLRALTIAYGGSIILAILEGAQGIWDNFHVAHFPLSLTRTILPLVFLLSGRAIYQIYAHRDHLFKR